MRCHIDRSIDFCIGLTHICTYRQIMIVILGSLGRRAKSSPVGSKRGVSPLDAENISRLILHPFSSWKELDMLQTRYDWDVAPWVGVGGDATGGVERQNFSISASSSTIEANHWLVSNLLFCSWKRPVQRVLVAKVQLNLVENHDKWLVWSRFTAGHYFCLKLWANQYDHCLESAVCLSLKDTLGIA